jgi:hypothetical protein
VGVGHNSDGNGPADPGWNTEWIYCHNIKVNDRLEWGLGLDAQQYFTAGHIIPYPLIFFDWRVGSATELRIDADYLEARQYLTQNFSVAAGVRFNLEFFSLGQNGTYEYNSAGGEMGMQYAVADHVFLRLNYKQLFYGEEEIGLPQGATHTRSLPTGNSLRLNVAFGI